MWALLKRGPLADLSTPKDQKPGDQGKKSWRFWEKPGGLSTRSKRSVSLMWALLKRGPLADLSTPKDQKPGDQGKKSWRFGEKPGGLSTASKRTKTRCREDIKTKMDC